MYFVIESQEQLGRLGPSENCFIHVIPLNDKYHPKLTGVSMVYYNNFDKGYLLCVNHSESFSISVEEIQKFLDLHSKVYMLDYKYHSYFFSFKNPVDLYFAQLDILNEHRVEDCDTVTQKHFYMRDSLQRDLNRVIPMTKHYEKCECLFQSTFGYADLEYHSDFYKRMSDAYMEVENSGVLVDFEKFKDHFTLESYDYSVKGSVIYTYYNLYNLTQRPTNAFNGFNALAIPKDKDIRSAFLPKNDAFLEFDFDAYHLRIIAGLIDYEVPKESFHTFLGRQYFEKQDLSEEEYQESKKITFRQLYGGVEEKYNHVEFFSKIEDYATTEYSKYRKNKNYQLPTGRSVKYSPSISKYKLFNYIIQNIETKENVDKIEKINALLKDKKTKLVLITYDSFLFDVSTEDGKQLLKRIKDILEEGCYITKHRFGKDYSLQQK
jgi:peroxiredoxin family protein